MTDKEAEQPLDEKTLSRLYEEMLPLVYRLVRSRGLDAMAAEDIVQDVFIDLFRQFKAGKQKPEGTNLKAYLYRLVKWRTFDYLRRRERQKETTLSEVDVEIGRPAEAESSLTDTLAAYLKDVAQNIEATVPEKYELRTHQRPALSVFVEPGDAPAELIAELYTSIDALYRSCGGSGLKVSKDERRTFIGELL